MKKVPLKDYQLLLDDSAFRAILGDQVQWQTYSIGGSIWLCAEIHELIWIDQISKLHNYCFPRPLRAKVCCHPTKPDYLLLMVQKDCHGRLTKKKLAPPNPTDAKILLAFTRLKKAMERDKGCLSTSGAVEIAAKNLSKLLTNF